MASGVPVPVADGPGEVAGTAAGPLPGVLVPVLEVVTVALPGTAEVLPVVEVAVEDEVAVLVLFVP